MPTLTTTEITEFLNADAEARTNANITRRALTLFESGYSAIQDSPNFYTILTPAEGRYTVHINEDDPANDVFGNFCSCPCFDSRKTCKHLQAVVNQREQEARLLSAYEARMDNDDDLYSEF
jgi:hypothetical protein